MPRYDQRMNGDDEAQDPGPELDEDEEFNALSPLLEAQLAAFVMIEDVELAVSRLETLDYLVDMLRDLEDAEEVAGWVERYGAQDFHLAQERDGRLVVTDIFPVTGVLGFIPREVVALVAKEMTDQAEDDLELWIETLGDLVAESLALVADEEKMVGHLVLAHDLSTDDLDADHAELVARHVRLHGPTEPGPDEDQGGDEPADEG